MIAVVSDTHRESGHGLRGRALEAVREAERVCHAGDFTTPAVYEAFLGEADRLEAVRGNSDRPALADRLPPKRVFACGGLRVVLVHGHEHSGTALALLARQEDADVVVSGHTHRPRAVVRDGRVFLDPGSHDEPRGGRAAHAELDTDPSGLEGRLLGPDGEVFETFDVPRFEE